MLVFWMLLWEQNFYYFWSQLEQHHIWVYLAVISCIYHRNISLGVNDQCISIIGSNNLWRSMFTRGFAGFHNSGIFFQRSSWDLEHLWRIPCINQWSMHILRIFFPWTIPKNKGLLIIAQRRTAMKFWGKNSARFLNCQDFSNSKTFQ